MLCRHYVRPVYTPKDINALVVQTPELLNAFKGHHLLQLLIPIFRLVLLRSVVKPQDPVFATSIINVNCIDVPDDS